VAAQFNTIKKKSSLYEEVAEIIKDAILSKRYIPGDALPSEGDLAAQFGVSRNVVREAMRSLQSRGFVEIRRGKKGGAYILDLKATTISENLSDLIHMGSVDPDHISYARRYLEPEVVRLASIHASPERLARIEEILDEFDRTKDGERRIELNCEFHRQIGRACGNPFFSILMDVLMDFTERFVKTLNPYRKLLHHDDEHHKIFAAVKEGDTETASALARKHVDHMAKELMRLAKNYKALVNRQIN